ncbi:MAG: hypothetical protein R2728_01390 [Chitinophagales bacterium]
MKKEYIESKHEVNKVFDSLKKKLSDININNKIDCVIISGDLSYKGHGDEFAALSKVLTEAIPRKTDLKLCGQPR